MSKPVVLTRATFHTWLKANSPRYSVLMVKKDDCVPCGRVLPIYEKYANAWDATNNIRTKRVITPKCYQSYLLWSAGTACSPYFTACLKCHIYI